MGNLNYLCHRILFANVTKEKSGNTLNFIIYWPICWSMSLLHEQAISAWSMTYKNNTSLNDILSGKKLGEKIIIQDHILVTELIIFFSCKKKKISCKTTNEPHNHSDMCKDFTMLFLKFTWTTVKPRR